MRKTADLLDEMMNMPDNVRLGSLVAGSLLGAVGGGIYGLKLRNEIMRLKRNKRRYALMAEEMGVSPKIPIERAGALENAYYMPKETYWLNEQIRRLAGTKSTKLDRLGVETGTIGYGRNFDRPAIVAHELGHASIGNEHWSSPSRINQMYGRIATLPFNIANVILSPLVGAGVGRRAGQMTKELSKSVLGASGRGVDLAAMGIGGLAGGLAPAAIGALVNAPTLINEWQASSRAKDWIEHSNMSTKEKQKSRDALDRAFGSYVLGSTLTPGIAGAAGGLYGASA